MPYSPAAVELRRCTCTTKSGEQCRAWAVWGDTSRRCVSHGGQPSTPPRRNPGRARAEPCECAAYRWPHKPAGGLCRWPDPPLRRLLTPPSTHRWPSRFRAQVRRLVDPEAADAEATDAELRRLLDPEATDAELRRLLDPETIDAELRRLLDPEARAPRTRRAIPSP